MYRESSIPRRWNLNIHGKTLLVDDFTHGKKIGVYRATRIYRNVERYRGEVEKSDRCIRSTNDRSKNSSAVRADGSINFKADNKFPVASGSPLGPRVLARGAIIVFQNFSSRLSPASSVSPEGRNNLYIISFASRDYRSPGTFLSNYPRDTGETSFPCPGSLFSLERKCDTFLGQRVAARRR